MYYAESISPQKAEELLNKCGLKTPEGTDYTAGVFDDGGFLAASASLKGDMIQGVAVDPSRQGEDLMGTLLTHVIKVAGERGLSDLYLFTKPEKAVQFEGLGFRHVATARPYAALMEWGSKGIGAYKEKLRKVRKDAGVAGAIVMNCNPFTRGHRYLVEQARAQVDVLYVIVVEEDKSLFTFAHRIEMARRATADLENVVVLGGDRYAVSSLTFPSYFTKEENLAAAHTAMDAEIFARHIGPELGVTKRFVGTEPLSPVTEVYNQALLARLPRAGIEVEVIERLEEEGQPVSASRVRALLGDSLDMPSEDRLAELAKLLPQPVLEYMKEKVFTPRQLTLMDLLDSRENRAAHQQELLKKYGGSLISMTLNIPGPVKDSPEYRKVLHCGMKAMKESLDAEHITFEEVRELVTGTEGYICVKDVEPTELKKIAVRIEEVNPLGRLFDMDVLTADGGISRAALGAPPRRCLICQRDAKACARSRAHSMEDLLAEVDKIIAKNL